MSDIFRKVLLIGVGGGIGSIFRYLTSLMVHSVFTTFLPLGTAAVNIIGCFLIGFLTATWANANHDGGHWRYVLVTGFCGGYTTFSAFAFENHDLFQSGSWVTGFSYTLISVVLGVAAVWLGVWLAGN